MAEYFVNIDLGDDTNDGLTELTPKQNIQPTIDGAAASDIITLMDGTWYEVVNVNKGVTLRAANAHAAIIDGQHTLPSKPLARQPQTTTDGCLGGTVTSAGSHFAPLLKVSSGGVVLDGIVITRSMGRGVQVTNGGAIMVGLTIRNCKVTYNYRQGLKIFDVDTLLVEDTEVGWNLYDAPFSRSPSLTDLNYGSNASARNCDGVVWRNCDIHSGWGEGLYPNENGRGSCLMEACSVHDNLGLQVYLHYSPDTTIDNCDVWFSDSPLRYRGKPEGCFPPHGIAINMEDDEQHRHYARNGNIVVRNSRFMNNRSHIGFWGNEGGPLTTDGIDIYNNTFNHVYDGVLSSVFRFQGDWRNGKYLNVNIFNNVITEPDAGQLTTYDLDDSDTRDFATWGYNNWAVQPPAQARGAGDIYQAPALSSPVEVVSYGTQPVKTNYELTASSPAVNAGTSNFNGVASATVDWDGAARSTVDMGGHEYGGVIDTGTTTFYVSQAGDNSDGLTPATAWQDFGDIVWASVDPGDTINVLAGTYNDALNVGASGTSGNVITIQATGIVEHVGSRGNTLLPEAGATFSPAETNTETGIICSEDYVVIDGGDLVQWRVHGWKGQGVSLTSASSNCTIKNLEVRNNGYVELKDEWDAPDFSDPGNPVAYPNGAGVRIGGSDHLFELLVVHDNGQDCFQSQDGSNNLGNITFRQCWGYNAREHTIANAAPPQGNNNASFNWNSHPDFLQIYDGGEVDGITIERCWAGPGLMNGLILGQTDPNSGANLLTNPGFESSKTGWSDELASGGSWSTPLNSAVGSRGAKITASGDNGDRIYQTGLSVTSGTTYGISLYLDGSASVDVKLHENGDPTNTYGLDQTVTGVTSGWQQYTLTPFVCDTTDADAVLSIIIGPYYNSGSFVRVDEVSLTPGGNDTTVINVDIDDLAISQCTENAILSYPPLTGNTGWDMNRMTIVGVNTDQHLIQTSSTSQVVTNSIFQGGAGGADINFLDAGEPGTSTNNYQYDAQASDTIGTVADPQFTTLSSDVFATNDFDVGNGAVTGAGTQWPTPAETMGEGSTSGPDANGTYTFSAGPANQPPVVVYPGVQNSTNGDVISLQIAATDPEEDTITYSATGLPTGLSIASGTGLITGTIAAVGTFSTVVTATDSETNAGQTSFSWAVAAAPSNRAPTIFLADQTGTINDSVSVTPTANDEDGDTLTFSAIGLPPDLTIIPSTGQITGELTESGTFTPEITVSDGALTDSHILQWVVADPPDPDTPPIITAIADQSHTIGDTISIQAAANESVTWSISGNPSGTGINSSSGLISGQLAAAGDFTVTVTATNGADAVDTEVFAWAVADVVVTPPDVVVATTPPNAATVRMVVPAGDIMRQVRVTMRDNSATPRWTDGEILNAINRSLDTWAERVFIPNIYTMQEQFTWDKDTYAIPYYVSGPMTPQRKVERFYWQDISTSDGEYGWSDIYGARLESDGTGGQNLYVEVLGDRFTVDTGRIVWYSQQGHVPTFDVSLAYDMTAADTECTISADLIHAIGDVGFVKIGREIMQYSGVLEGSGSIILRNLIRGFNGTLVSTHTSSTQVEWCIAIPDQRLYNVLTTQIQSYMQHFFMTDASPRETKHHQWMIRWETQLVDNFWATWIPNRPSGMKLSRMSLGGRRR